MTIAAPRKSGKSFFISKLLSSPLESTYDKIIILCPSIDFNQDYDRFRKNDKFKLLSEPNRDVIDGTFERLSELKNEEIEKKRLGIKLTERAPRVLIIFDDCIDSGLFNFRGGVDKIAERGRHVNLSCIISSQRISAVSRSIRINSDMFIIFVPYAAREMEQFIEQFVFKDFRKTMVTKLLEVFSKPYQFILLDNQEKNILSKLKTSNADDFMKNKIKIIELNKIKKC
jgi:hypothetical protein